MEAVPAEERSRILRECHSGNLPQLVEFKRKHPQTHWTELRHDKSGDTVLHVAARLGYVEIVRFICGNYDPPRLDFKNLDDKTPLHEAAQFSRLDCAKCLLDHGAGVDSLKRADWTPLMLSCTKSCFDTLQLLLDRGAVVNFANKDGWTAAHLICREGHLRMLELLTSRGGDVEKTTKNGRTCLHISSLHGHSDLVRFLLGRNSSVQCQDNCGNTALHEAVLGGRLEVFVLLLSRAGDHQVRNKAGFGLLHLAASVGHLDMIEYIVGVLGHDVNGKAGGGWTALHCAAKKGQSEALRLLVSLGGDARAVDQFNRTARDYLPSVCLF